MADVSFPVPPWSSREPPGDVRRVRVIRLIDHVPVAGSGGMMRFLFMTLVILGLIGLATMLAFVLR
jgi:hypothetical protein